MSSAVTESATYETSVIGPDGTDLISAAGVRNGLQDVANRTKWLKESLVVGGSKTLAMTGVAYPTSSSKTIVTDGASATSSFTLTVAVGDIVHLFASGSGVNATGTAAFDRDWYDGSAIIAATGYSTPPASPDVSLSAVKVASSAGSTTFTFRTAMASSMSIPGHTPLYLSYVHIKKGA